jgi:hypothetical protein
MQHYNIIERDLDYHGDTAKWAAIAEVGGSWTPTDTNKWYYDERQTLWLPLEYESVFDDQRGNWDYQAADVMLCMQIVLTATEPPLADAWQRFCGDLPNITVHRGSILDVACDAVVSPANSFGFMDGGIDMVYSQFFGWHVQTWLQDLQYD